MSLFKTLAKGFIQGATSSAKRQVRQNPNKFVQAAVKGYDAGKAVGEKAGQQSVRPTKKG